MTIQKIEECIAAVGRAALRLNDTLDDKHLFSRENTEYINTTNASGDKVSKIDLVANYIFTTEFEKSFCFAALASEEAENAGLCYGSSSKYIISIDPLDGSENFKTDNQLGTIFGIHKKIDALSTNEEFLQPGKSLVAAGYVLYGHRPILVFADSFTNKVRARVIRRDQGLFTEYEPDIKCPEEGKIVAVNSGNYPRWNQLTCNWFDAVVEYGKSSFRYSGCMVADFHRILLHGGIFAYPSDRKNLNGKLRLLFECAPLAFVMHMAGGASTNGDSKTKSILDITPSSLHQTTPVFLGSKQNIEDYFRG